MKPIIKIYYIIYESLKKTKKEPQVYISKMRIKDEATCIVTVFLVDGAIISQCKHAVFSVSCSKV